MSERAVEGKIIQQSVRMLLVHAHMYRKLKPNGEVVNRGLNVGVY